MYEEGKSKGDVKKTRIVYGVKGDYGERIMSEKLSDALQSTS